MLQEIRNNTKNQKGFTLVELMVVIAIIGVLAAIAVPKYLDTTVTAKGAKIVADLRTIDSAIMMAIADGKSVAAVTDVSASATAGSFLDAVQSHLSTPSKVKPPQGATFTVNGFTYTKANTDATYGIGDSGAINGRAYITTTAVSPTTGTSGDKTADSF